VLLADDHFEFRQSFRNMLEAYRDLEVVAEAASLSEAVGLAGIHHPDLAVLDVRMKDGNGMDAIPRIRRCSPCTVFLMLSMHRDPRYVIESLRAGALEYLLKDSAESELIAAIRRAFAARAALQSPA
jgi:DNA-binding NarL/FixJ family response regulator